MIYKEIKDAKIINNELFKNWYLLVSEKYKIKVELCLNHSGYNALMVSQKQYPKSLIEDEWHRTWWLFQDKIYFADNSVNSELLKALVLAKQNKKERIINKAILLQQLSNCESSKKRELISDKVKIFVWQRDGGKCVKCDSQEKLEYDHIIPFSKGGSNSERNIQLLCEKCNRSKHDNIV